MKRDMVHLLLARVLSIARFAALLLLVSGTAGGSYVQPDHTEPAGTIRPAERYASANWRMSGMLSEGGILHRTAVCAEVDSGQPGEDDSDAIQAAIDRCSPGEVVRLGAGTFTIKEGKYILLNRSITLRGAGPGSTILKREHGAKPGSYFPGADPSPMIIVGPQRYNNNSSSTALTTSVAAGAYAVHVASVAGFSEGQIVLLDEASGAGWQPDVVWPDRQIWASSDYRVVWQKHMPFYKYVDDFGADLYPYTPGGAGCWFSNCDRPTNEMHRIAAISGNVITFDSPIMISYRVSHQAQLHRWQTHHTHNAGVENLTVSNGDDGNIKFLWCAYCWAYNVENTLWLGGGFDINFSFRVQLEGVYVHNPAWPVSGGGGYNISLAWGSSEVLIEDSISVLTNKVIVARSAGAGSVVAYNYMDDGYINGRDHWQEIGLNASHMAGSHHVLFEGNYSFNIDSDQTHGNAIYHTFFRNYANGFRRPFTALDGSSVDDTTGCCHPLRAAGAHAYAYWFSFIGNVLGKQRYTSGWAYEGKGGHNAFPPSSIWMLGYMDISPQGYDPNVAATAFRDGNFDYLTNSVHWALSNAEHELPASQYLPGKPAFFTGYSWPWVEPTGSGEHLHTLPAKARYDAGTPFVQPVDR